MTRPRREFAADLRTRRRDSRRRILDAAAELLEERPWHEIALEEVMAEAELTRTAFYRHFDERSDLLLALVDESGVGADPGGGIWKTTEDDPVPALRAGIEVLVQLFVDHGRLLCAASQASIQEPSVREVYRGFAESFIESTATRIEADVAAGRSTVDNAGEVARALVWMNERYLIESFGSRPFVIDPESAVDALTQVWAGAIYHA